MKDLSFLNSLEIVVTEKMDGENTSMHSDRIHARSENSAHHPSRSIVKALHSQIRNIIPENIQIFGENLYAKHSIEYDNLSDFFMTFMFLNKDTNTVASWDDTLDLCKNFGLKNVPEIYRGKLKNWDKVFKPSSGKDIEGYVIRVSEEFRVDNFPTHIGKFVRANHVQTDKHWTTTWSPNKLSKGMV